MKKKQFISLIICVAAGLAFSLGVCMMLLPEWGMTEIGVFPTAAGAVVLLVLAVALRKMSDKSAKKPNWKFIGKVIYGVVSSLVLGIGMSMIMAFKDMMLAGIIVGVIGILMLLCLIPMFTGFKE